MPPYIVVLGYTIPTIVVAAVTGASLFGFFYLCWVDIVESLERCSRKIDTSFDMLKIEVEDSGHNLEGMWTKVTVTLCGNGPIEAYKNDKFKGQVWPILFGIARDALVRTSTEQINYQVYANTMANLKIICASYEVELSEVVCLISYPDD